MKTTSKKATGNLAEKMGTNIVSHYEQENAQKRSSVIKEVGDYLLRLDTRWHLWAAERTDGGDVPKPLKGKWTDPDDFIVTARRVHGEGYALDGAADE